MSKLTNFLIPFILISTGVLFCTSNSIARKEDIINQQFVNTINQNDIHQQAQPQSNGKYVASQTKLVRIPTKKKPSAINTKSKYPVQKATGDENEAIKRKAISRIRESKPVFSDYANKIESGPAHGEFTTVNLIEKTETLTELEESEEDNGKKNIYNLSAGQQDKKDLSQVGLAHLNLGIAYAERGLIDHAILEFQSAIEANPYHIESHVRLGTTYGLKGMTNEALSQFKKAIDINLNEAVAKIVFNAFPVAANQKVKTDVVKAHINLGNAYKEEGILKRSQLEYEKALALKPEHPIARKSLSEIYYSLGTSYLENKEYDNAIDAFNKVLELNPGFPQIKDVLEKTHYNLGMNYAENGELDKAIMEFNKVIEINPNYAKLDKNNLNIISKDEKAVSGKHIHHDRNRPDENVYNSTNGDKRKDSSHVEEKEGESLRKQIPHKIDVAEEIILAEKGNAKESEYDHNLVESQLSLLHSREENKGKLVTSNKASLESGQLQKTDDSKYEKVKLKTEMSKEGLDEKQTQKNIASVQTIDTNKTDISVTIGQSVLPFNHNEYSQPDGSLFLEMKVSDLDFLNEEKDSLQIRDEKETKTSKAYNLGKRQEISKESSNQSILPNEFVAIEATSPDDKADNNTLANTHITPREIINENVEKAVAESKDISDSGHWNFSYYMIRNYKTNMGFDEAIQKYEEATQKNPYDNNAFLHLAHACYSKAVHLDDAIARMEDVPEGNQNFSVQRFYLNDDTGNEKISVANLTEQAKTLEEYNITFHNKLGNLYHKKEMFSEAIVEYKNVLKIDPNSSKTLYNLAFSSKAYILNERKKISKESSTQSIIPNEFVAIKVNSPNDQADDHILVNTHLVPGEINNKSISNYNSFSYYITRNYNSKIGFNDAIKKYEDAARKNPYDNNSFLNLAHAYYSKAMYLDDAITRREDAPEGNQHFSVQRFFLNDDTGNEGICEVSLTEQTKTLEEYNMTFYNKLGNLYHKKERFSEAIVEYKNALEIDPKSSKALYNLAFSFSKKGSYLGTALRSKNNPKRTLSEF